MELNRNMVGLLLIVFGTVLLGLPPVRPMQMYAVGLGVSHRDRDVTVLTDRVSSFEVGKVWNTGDETYDVEAVWRATGGSLAASVYVDLYPDVRTLRPGESYLLIAKVATPKETGTVTGVVELILETGQEPPQEIGGVVVPGAELQFSITVVEPEAEGGGFRLPSIPLQTLLGLVSFSAGVLVVADNELRRR